MIEDKIIRHIRYKCFDGSTLEKCSKLNVMWDDIFFFKKKKYIYPHGIFTQQWQSDKLLLAS
jgi:hypothetical protein